MKRKRLVLILCLVLGLSFQSCSKKEMPINQFTSDQDTLKIQLTKGKGGGLFSLGYGTINFEAHKNAYPTQVIVPKDIDSLKRYPFQVDVIEKIHPTYVEIVKGFKKGKPIVIIDQNNNKDLRDDPVREYKQIDWNNQETIPVRYTILKGARKVQDSSWLRFGSNYGSFLLGKNEHVSADFSVDGQKYSIQAVDLWTLGFNYMSSTQLVLSSTPEQTKDSISERDMLQNGELLNLDNNFYRYHEISNDGQLLTLIKDQQIQEKTGTQVGMKAPDFSVVSTEGENLTKDQFKDKITIIANSCGCGGDKKSTQAVADIQNAYGDKLNVLQIDSAIKEKLNTYQIDSEEKINKSFYNTYRKTYCSRLVYVIGTNGLILDKFSIFKWKEVLPSLI